ncbi:hypothetical protein WA026_016619 [Henosepilachna vigintioctopunctata]|uniref:Protein prenyltransferase alpha subunit repeat-containing protein 1 n=1 Tax=Henosepilachna vigintioctopunctata TaxID=420089 RepID=A0AAW1V802_9CUCU
MVEQNAMCEKILRKLEHILSINTEIQEFAIVPTPEIEKNKSPVLYEHNCLGIESWCKQYLLQYTHSNLLEARKDLIRNSLTFEEKKNLNRVLIGALLIQPNVTTFWNMKRELVKSDILNTQLELDFSRIALTYHSKCNEIFSYRKWLIDLINLKQKNYALYKNELSLCETATEKSKNNYHAWNHRIWCLQNISAQYLEDMLISELNFSLSWISKHISEFSGFFYRQVLINSLHNLKSLFQIQMFNLEGILKYLKFSTLYDDPLYVFFHLLGKSNVFPIIEDCPKFVNLLAVLLHDLTYISTELNFLYCDHECLWNYRKFLVIHIMNVLYEYHGVVFHYHLVIPSENRTSLNEINMLNLDIKEVRNEIPRKVSSSNLYKIVIQNELEFIESNKNMVNILQNNLALRYFKWLKCSNFYKY